MDRLSRMVKNRDTRLVLVVTLACAFIGAGIYKVLHHGPVAYQVITSNRSVTEPSYKVLVAPGTSESALSWVMADIKKHRSAEGCRFIFVTANDETQSSQIAVCDVAATGDSCLYILPPKGR